MISTLPAWSTDFSAIRCWRLERGGDGVNESLPPPKPKVEAGNSIDSATNHTYPVCMANVTLSIPDDLLKRGRNYAEARGTSLNALVRELLDETVSNPESAVDSMIERLRQSVGDSKGVKVHREELHRY